MVQLKISSFALTLTSYLIAFVTAGSLRDMRSAMKEIQRLQSGCTSGQYLDIETSTCKSCDLFCENGLHLERCGITCRDYFHIKNLTMTIAKKDEALMNATDTNYAYQEKIENKDDDIRALKSTVLALVIFIIALFAVAVLVCIAVYKLSAHLPRKSPRRPPEGDVVLQNRHDEAVNVQDHNDEQRDHELGGIVRNV